MANYPSSPNKKAAFIFFISSVGFTAVDTSITLPAALVEVSMKPLALFLEPVEIKALRAGEKAPFAKSNLSKTILRNETSGRIFHLL